jgi:hypothetical protein
MEAPVFVKVFCAPFSIQDDFSLQFQWTELWEGVGYGLRWGVDLWTSRQVQHCLSVWRGRSSSVHACSFLPSMHALAGEQCRRAGVFLLDSFGHGSSQDMLYAARIYTHAALQSRCIHVISERSPGSDHCASLGGRRWENPRWCRCRSWWGY